jgi:hypothetical protein
MPEQEQLAKMDERGHEVSGVKAPTQVYSKAQSQESRLDRSIVGSCQYAAVPQFSWFK